MKMKTKIIIKNILFYYFIEGKVPLLYYNHRIYCNKYLRVNFAILASIKAVSSYDVLSMAAMIQK